MSISRWPARRPLSPFGGAGKSVSRAELKELRELPVSVGARVGKGGGEWMASIRYNVVQYQDYKL